MDSAARREQLVQHYIAARGIHDHVSFRREDLGAVSFVPLIGQHGRAA